MWCSPLAITHMCFLSLCSKLCETHFFCSRGPEQLQAHILCSRTRQDSMMSFHLPFIPVNAQLVGKRLQGFRVKKCICCEGRVGNRSQRSGPKPSGPWVVPMGPLKTLTWVISLSYPGRGWVILRMDLMLTGASLYWCNFFLLSTLLTRKILLPGFLNLGLGGQERGIRLSGPFKDHIVPLTSTQTPAV